jgi:hypothetical protein
MTFEPNTRLFFNLHLRDANSNRERKEKSICCFRLSNLLVSAKKEKKTENSKRKKKVFVLKYFIPPSLPKSPPVTLKENLVEKNAGSGTMRGPGAHSRGGLS